MKNKNILITGASSGLGQKMAHALALQGANLTLFSRSQQPMGSSLIVKGDISKSEDCERAISLAIERFGSLDYLILNAGISMWAPFNQVLDLNLLKTLIDTNYLGSVYFTHYALPYLKKTKGMIVVISSIQGQIPVPYHTGYAASKHALTGFFNTLRMEESIDILAVFPSWIDGTKIGEHSISGKQRKKGLRLDFCVDRIIQAMKKRSKELYIPRHYALLPLMRSLFPKLLNRLIMRAVRKKQGSY